jgi:hypothetical protein
MKIREEIINLIPVQGTLEWLLHPQVLACALLEWWVRANAMAAKPIKIAK